jgi:uncharacterized membrane protein YeaQ/YmgE (transglycosylase-associated protein family)
MNIFIWMVAGGILGWVGFAFWKFNEDRGPVVSVIIGAVGGLFGGHVVAPMFLAASQLPGSFSTSALFFAAVVATAFLFVGSMIYDRWGV